MVVHAPVIECGVDARAVVRVAVQAQQEGERLTRRQVAVQRVGMADVDEPAGSIGRDGERGAVEQQLAVLRRGDAGHQAQQAGLAAAVAAPHPHKLARVQVEVETFEQRPRAAPAGEGARREQRHNVGERQGGLQHGCFGQGSATGCKTRAGSTPFARSRAHPRACAIRRRGLRAPRAVGARPDGCVLIRTRLRSSETRRCFRSHLNHLFASAPEKRQPDPNATGRHGPA